MFPARPWEGWPRPEGSVAVAFRFVGAFDADADVGGLFFGEGGEFATEFAEVEAGYFFVELFREDFDADGALAAAFPEGDLGEYLVGEAVGHDEAGVAGGASEVDEAAFCKEVDAVAVREGVFVYLRFDVEALDAGVGFEFGDLDFVVEVADVADDGLVAHAFHVFDADDVAVACGGDVDVAPAEGVFDGEDAVAFHGGLKGADGVYFGDDDLCAESAEGLGAAFAYIAIAADDGDFAGDHDVGGAFDAVHKGFAAAVEVVEFGFGDGVVDVDGGEEEAAFGVHLVEAMDSGGGFFGDAFDFRHPAVEDAGLFGGDFFEEGFDDLFFVGFGGGVYPVAAVFHFVAFVEEEGGVPSVVDDELGAEAVPMGEGFPCAVPVFFEGFAFPCEDGGAVVRDGGGGMVLRGEDVAAGPADVCAEGDEGFDEDGRLDGHVEGAGDADSLEGLGGCVFFTDGHEAGHFVFGDGDFLVAEVGKGDVADGVRVCGVHGGGEVQSAWRSAWSLSVSSCSQGRSSLVKWP